MLCENDGIGRRLMTLSLVHRLMMQKATADFGMNWRQLPMLEVIANNGGCTQKELADKLMITPASAALSTKRLQKAGYIIKEVDPNNLRCNMLTATEKGIKCLSDCVRSFRQVDDAMISGLGEEELDRLLTLLDKMILHITDTEGIPMDPRSIIKMEHKLKQQEDQEDDI